MSECIQFCSGCEFANGVTQANRYVDNMAGSTVEPDFEMQFVDDEGNKTNTLTAFIAGDDDTALPNSAFFQVQGLAQECQGPVPTRVPKLFGLLGDKAVTGCGMFRGQDPKNPTIDVGATTVC